MSERSAWALRRPRSRGRSGNGFDSGPLDIQQDFLVQFGEHLEYLGFRGVGFQLRRQVKVVVERVVIASPLPGHDVLAQVGDLAMSMLRNVHFRTRGQRLVRSLAH